MLMNDDWFRATFERLPASMVITDAEGRFLQVNLAFCQFLGYTEDELLRLRLLDVTHPGDRAETQRYFSEVLAGLRQTIDLEKRCTRKDGATVWGHVTAVCFVDSNAKLTYCVAVIQDITERKQVEAALRESAARLQTLSHRLLEVQETERRSIARELHDEIGQALTSVKINLQTMQRLPELFAGAPYLEDSISLVERTLEQVRNLSLDLRPSLLDDLGLAPALRWYLDRQAQRAGFAMQFVADPWETRLPADLETVCFRVAQEAVTNIVRHAQASQVQVELRRSEVELQLIIRDDGVGFDVREARARAAAGASFGLQGMEERVRLVGGQLEIESTPEQGTQIRARFPRDRGAEERPAGARGDLRTDQ